MTPPSTVTQKQSPQGDPAVAEIEFRDVWKSFGPKKVLRGFSLSIGRGETVAILGASGSGKSVLLRHIVGLMNADRGEVLVNGEDVGGMDDKALLVIRRKVALIFQANALFDSMNIFDNVAFGLKEQRRLTKQEIAAKVGSALAMVGLENVEHQMPADLSGGMRKRVALARSMVLEPDAILYDEPTSGLDPITGHMVSSLIRDMAAKLHVTSVVVTHDIASAMMVADRMSLLGEGRAVFVGTPEEARRSSQREVREFFFAYGDMI